MKKYQTLIDGESFEGIALKKGQDVWIHFQGRTYLRSLKKRSSGSGQVMVEDPLQIIANMPGKIIKLKCAVGDIVQKGDTLVVLEAMKMEYNLKAAISGCVKEISKPAGEQVGLGEILVSLEATDANG